MFYVVVGLLGLMKLLKKEIVLVIFIVNYVLWANSPLQLGDFGNRSIYFFVYFSAGMLMYFYRDLIPINSKHNICNNVAVRYLSMEVFNKFYDIWKLFGNIHCT